MPAVKVEKKAIRESRFCCSEDVILFSTQPLSEITIRAQERIKTVLCLEKGWGRDKHYQVREIMTRGARQT